MQTGSIQKLYQGQAKEEIRGSVIQRLLLEVRWMILDKDKHIRGDTPVSWMNEGEKGKTSEACRRDGYQSIT